MADVTDFTNFLYNTAGIPQTALPSNAQVIQDAYNWGLAIVPCQFAAVCPSSIGTTIYDQAVYCAGASYIFNWSPDQPNMDYFATMRKQWGLLTYTGGVLSSTSDNGTGAGYTIPDWVKNATLMDLQWLKDPFGRQLMAILQQFGSLWGLS